MLLTILIIIAVAYYINKKNNEIDKLKEENRKLRKSLELLKEKNLKTENNVATSSQAVYSKSNIDTNIVEKKELTAEEKEILRIKKEKLEREKKNTTVLLTGAILIVLAAIVFLMSTWNTVSNIVKTGVLVLLIGVFLGASKIAKERFKLEKTSNTFFYLAMAYIPICLISCSVFGLFGKYLSIYGEGKFAYLSIAMLFTSIIYYINYKQKDSAILFYGCILSQICSLILFVVIFETNILLIAIILLIYNISLILLTKENTQLELINYFYTGIPYLAGIISIGYVFESNSYMLLLMPLLMINFFLLNKKNEINAYLFNIVLYVFGLYFSFTYEFGVEINEGIKVLFGTLYTIAVLVAEGFLFRNEGNIIKSSMIVSMCSIGIIYLRTINVGTTFIKPFMISALEAMLMLFIYIKSKETGKNVLSILIPITLIITLFHILLEIEAMYQMYIIAALIVFVIGELLQGKEFLLLNKGFLIVSNINIVITFFACALNYGEELSNDVMFFILLGIIYAYSFLKNRNYIIFKYLSYITIGMILLTSMNFLEMSTQAILLIPVIQNIIILVLEEYYKDLKDSFSRIFTSLLSCVAYLTLNGLDSKNTVFLGLLFSIYLIYENFKSGSNKYLRIIPMLGFFTVISNFHTELGTEVSSSILLLVTIATTCISLYQKKVSIDTIFSGIYLMLTLECFDNTIIKEIFFIIWACINIYFMESQKTKDVFKGLLYIGAYSLYSTFISEFCMNQLICWNAMGIMIVAVLCFKTIISNYVNPTDNLEYLVYAMIYLGVIMSYNSEADGMMFVLFIVALIMFSYMKKYGVVFIVSIFAVLANAFLLTRRFWGNIPWWIYILLVGGTLMGFAIKNESDGKKVNLNVVNAIKNLKDKIER